MSDLYPQTHLSSESHINRAVRLTNWWHRQLDGHEFDQAPGVDGQGSMVSYSPRDCKESDTTEQLNWTDRLTQGGSIYTLQHVHSCSDAAQESHTHTFPWGLLSEASSYWDIFGREPLIKTKKPWKLFEDPWKFIQKQAGLCNEAERRTNP